MSETKALVERLAAGQVLSGVPEAELVWLASCGSVRSLASGDVLAPHEADATEGLFIMLSGCVDMHMSRGGERRKAAEWKAGDVLGLLPYSRMKTPPGDLVAAEASEVLVVHRNRFPDMVRECHQTTSRLVHVMLDRARVFKATDLHDEKLASLGRMAAGLAHELNNPASAVVSGARLLVERLEEAQKASRALAAADLDSEQLEAIDQLHLVCSERMTKVLSPLEQADLEESISDWLEDHGASLDHVDVLASSDLTLEMLDELAERLEGRALEAALGWVAAMSSSRSLAVEIEEAASNVHDLVRAVQGFTAMDRALVPEPIDVGAGLSTTVLVLKSKAKEKSAKLSLEVEDGLPRVEAFRGELNQVWVNLIANALDAIEEEGSVRVRAERQGDDVVVRVIDDGKGIPDDVREHIFEPFYTTKGVGEGMGLGLDIVLRLVQRNEGEIEVESEPGRTEFRVRLEALDA